jgi:hypothetical protein
MAALHDNKRKRSVSSDDDRSSLEVPIAKRPRGTATARTRAESNCELFFGPTSLFHADLRVELVSVMSYATLANLARSCKAWHTTLCKQSTGRLFMPTAWRRVLWKNQNDRWSWASSAERKALQAFMTCQADLHVLDGLEGATGSELPELEIEWTGPATVVFRLGPVWQFNIVNGLLISTWTLDEIKVNKDRFLALKDQARAAHRQVLEEQRLRRQVPQEIRDQRTHWFHERANRNRRHGELVKNLASNVRNMSPCEAIPLLEKTLAAARALEEADRELARANRAVDLAIQKATDSERGMKKK